MAYLRSPEVYPKGNVRGVFRLQVIRWLGYIYYLAPMDKKIIDITPAYLIDVSRQLQTLNGFYLQEGLPSLTDHFNATLNRCFTQLNQCLLLYTDDPQMSQCSLLRCKSVLETFVLEQVSSLLFKDSNELACIVHELAHNSCRYVQEMQLIVLSDRSRRQEEMSSEKDRVILNLRKDNAFKKEMLGEVQERVNELESENASLYSKLITNAKHLALGKHHKSFGETARYRTEPLRNAQTSKQTEDTILDIMEQKAKQEAAKSKKTSLAAFLKTYFRFKFGMKELAEDSEASFREAVLHRSNEKNVFLLFQCMLDEECQEGYFSESKALHERVSKIVKRYLSERRGEGEKTLESNAPLQESEVKGILSFVYKTVEVDSLQMIFNELVGTEMMVVHKLINQILNYELKKHLFKVEDIVREAKNVTKGSATYDELLTLIVKLGIPQEKYSSVLKNQEVWADRTFTSSEIIEIVEKMRRRPKKKEM